MKCLNNPGRVKPASKRRLQILLAAWLALALLLPGPARAAHSEPPMPISPAGAVALVRIDLSGPAELSDLGGLGLKFYAQVEIEPGRVILLLPAEADQQTRLAQMGYAVQVLDGDVQGAAYCLLYGTAKELAQAQSETPLLLAAGRYGLARATPEQSQRFIQIGLRVTPLSAQPLNAAAVAAVPGRPVESTAANPVVQGMVDQVSQAALYTELQNLTGERAIRVDGTDYFLTSRYSLSPTPIQKTTQYAYNAFQSLGLTTVFDPYTTPTRVALRNVVAEQPGLTQPQRIFLLTAHIDSTSNLPSQAAPGADDNASGAAAVLQAARILSQYDFGCTVRYVLFTGEEQGLYGSAAYAGDIKRNGDQVEGVLNLDMLAYNSPNTAATMELHTRPGNSGDLALATAFMEAVQSYHLDLTPILMPDSMGDSDHASFWNRDYAATIAIEDWEDHTPYYHRTTDRISSLNMPYYLEMARASVATMGHLGCLLDGQLRGVVRNQTTNAPLPGVTVQAWQNGLAVASAASDSAGVYRLPLLAGVYTLKVAAPGYSSLSQEAPAVSLGKETAQDLLLQPCATVQAPDFDFSPTSLEPGQSIAFNAWVAGGETPVNYTWSFGDQTSAAGPNVAHVFAIPGLYPVSLTADNVCGYPQTRTRNLAVGLNVLYLPVLWK